MTSRSLKDLSEKMKDIDFAMLSTHSPGGEIGSRPMSNNRDVDYDGDSWFFTTQDTGMVTDIEADPNVALSYQGKAGLLGLRPFFIAIAGEAELIHDKTLFAEHWTKDLGRWFKQGPDTPGLLMIKVHAKSAHFWDGEDKGEVLIERGAFVGGP